MVRGPSSSPWPHTRRESPRSRQTEKKNPAPQSVGQGFLSFDGRPNEPCRIVGQHLQPLDPQNGSACGLLPCSLAGAFPFGGPLTDGPFTAGAAAAAAGAAGAAAAGAAGAAAAAAGVALAPGAALPGFGTPIPCGAAGAVPAAAPPAGATGAGAGLAPSEHPVNPLAAAARASVATAHHTQRMCIEQNPPEGHLDGSTAGGKTRTGRNASQWTAGGRDHIHLLRSPRAPWPVGPSAAVRGRHLRIGSGALPHGQGRGRQPAP